MADGAPIGALLVRVGADIGDLIDGFDKADKAVGRFTGKVDQRLLQPLAKVSAAAATAGAAVFAFTKSAADAVDQIGKLSQKVGVSVESLSALKYAADLSDVSLEQLGTGLKQLSKFMVENKIEGVGVEEQLLRIADEFARAEDNEKKTAAAMKFFGKAGADLIPLLNQGRAGIEELRKEAEKLGIVFSTETARKAEELNDNLTRLKASAQGLHVELAGPLVEGLNKMAKAALEAKREGEGLLGMLQRAASQSFGGDERLIFDRKMIEAGKELLRVQEQLDRARRGDLPARPGKSMQDDIRDAEAAVKAAESRIKALQQMEDKLVPPAPKPSGGGSGDVVLPEDAGAAEKRRAFIAKQLQEDRDAKIKNQMEIYASISELRTTELEDERTFQEELASARIATYFHVEKAFEEHGERMARIDASVKDQQKQLERDRLQGAQQFFGNLASLMNTSSKRTFEIGKAAALAEGAVKAAQAVLNSYEFGTKIGGPYVGAAMAAAAAIAGLNYLNNIRQQQFGGGGGTPTPAGQGSSGIAAPTASAPAGDAGSTGARQTTVINLQGERFTRKDLRSLFDQINEEGRDGGRLFVVGAS